MAGDGSTKRTGFTRWIVLLLLAVGGAIVNVAVVFAISVYPSRLASATPALYRLVEVKPEDAIVVQRLGEGEARPMYNQWVSGGFGWTSTVSDTDQQPIADDDHFVSVLVFDAGWPMHAATGELWGVRGIREYKHSVLRQRVVGGPPVRDIIPLKPMWWGFAINTVFYAAILWLIVVAPFALRRRLRIRWGLCVKCAYPVGTSSVCTECGASIMRRRASVDGE